MRKKIIASLAALCLFVGIIVPAFATDLSAGGPIDLSSGEQSITTKIEAIKEAHYNKHAQGRQDIEDQDLAQYADFFISVEGVTVDDGETLSLSGGMVLTGEPVGISLGQDFWIYAPQYIFQGDDLYILVTALMFAEANGDNQVTLTAGDTEIVFQMPERNAHELETVTANGETKDWNISGSSDAREYTVSYTYDGDWNPPSWSVNRQMELHFLSNGQDIEDDTVYLTQKQMNGKLSYGLTMKDGKTGEKPYFIMYLPAYADKTNELIYQVSTLEYGPSSPITVKAPRYNPNPVTGVSLDKTELNFTAKNETATLTATVFPENAGDKSIKWSSSDETVATVSETGIVTAVGQGSATITVTTLDGGRTATCDVTVTLPEVNPPVEEETYSIILDFDDTKGSVILAPNRTTVTSADSVTVTVTPKEGYEVASVIVNEITEAVAKTGGSFVLDNFSGDVKISAAFSARAVTPPTKPGTSGSVVPPSEPVAPMEIDTESAVDEIQSTVVDRVTLTLSQPDIVDSNIFAELQKTDKTLIFAVMDNLGNPEYQWEFAGEDILLPQIFTSLEIRVSPLNDLTLAPIWEELSLEDSLYVEFMHSGLLPGKASVTLNVAERFEDGESLYFYYCNPDKEKLDLVAANLLVENGYVTLPMEHCSEYILTTEAVVVSDTSNPQTGDANPFGLITAMLTALVGCGTILAKKGFEK